MNFEREFWPWYRAAHSRLATRRWHAVATLAAAGGLGAALLWRRPSLALLGVLLDFAIAQASHRLLERNVTRPWQHPWLHLRAELRMFRGVVQGVLGEATAGGAHGVVRACGVTRRAGMRIIRHVVGGVVLLRARGMVPGVVRGVGVVGGVVLSIIHGFRDGPRGLGRAPADDEPLLGRAAPGPGVNRRRADPRRRAVALRRASMPARRTPRSASTRRD
ncbi:MAG: DUF962 domain-containing protein [Myxococcaceae bacterium]|nr:DUF962 domain-containing protein [Myxococcaceae bacterium]MCA3010920.1 DUF962 domain-containing protein [Myxococcaceae bacterium]